MPKRSYSNNGKKLDINELAKVIADQVTDNQPPHETSDNGRPENLKAKSGRKGGLKGGKARAKALSPERRKEIAKKAISARWKKQGKKIKNRKKE